MSPEMKIYRTVAEIICSPNISDLYDCELKRKLSFLVSPAFLVSSQALKASLAASLKVSFAVFSASRQ